MNLYTTQGSSDGTLLEALDITIERAEESGETTIDEYRPPTWEDLGHEDIACTIVEWIEEWMNEHETLCHEDGGPLLCGEDEAPEAYKAFFVAVKEFVKGASYMHEAAYVHVRSMTIDEAKVMLAREALLLGPDGGLPDPARIPTAVGRCGIDMPESAGEFEMRMALVEYIKRITETAKPHLAEDE